MSLKKEISILSHVEKNYRIGNFRKTAFPGSKRFLFQKNIFFNVLKTVLVVDLTF